MAFAAIQKLGPSWSPTTPEQPQLGSNFGEFPPIRAAFDREAYLLREAMLALVQAVKQPQLPEGYPSQVDSLAVWSPVTFRPENIAYKLTSAEIRELENAVHLFKGNILLSSARAIHNPNTAHSLKKGA